MKLAIAGSRSFNDFELLENKVDELRKEYAISSLISGGAKGADLLAEQYAAKHHLGIERILPDWKMHSRGAGHRRNEIIVQKCDMLIAFWDGKSKGTKHIIEYAKKQNKQAYIFNYADKKPVTTERLK
ncbi:MAG: DUF2493 domain-containing protein [Bacteroidetes bacterium]|nr:DUF2493 domain-containing protein [Bacteroidota bacterium]MBS1741012.1 DUF2493 domain-containing protein [Bacteroidota bacterium]